ncbi:MAG: hypothetical protein ACMUIM_09505, partial [bacterium]
MYVSLKKGRLIDGHIIQCRIHKARFDIKTGKIIWCAHFPPGIKALIETGRSTAWGYVHLHDLLKTGNHDVSFHF